MKYKIIFYSALFFMLMNTGCRSSDQTKDSESEKTDEELAAIATKMQKDKKREIKITLVNLVCEMSDDEGPFNDADMSIFKFTLDAVQQGCSEDHDKSIATGNIIYNYADVPITVSTGATWFEGNKSIAIYFNNADCPQYKLAMTINGYAREEDAGSSSDDEEANNSIEISSSSIFGTHTMHLNGGDFDYLCTFKIEKVGDW